MRINLKPALLLAALVFAQAASANEQLEPRRIDWPFAGGMGTLDKQSAQRGFQVYKEVCSACHSLKRVAFRNLADLGFSEAEIKALAATYQIHDGPNDAGDMFDRPGKASDTFPGPFANEQAAAAANNGAAPPDLSLIIKARHDGANYVYSLLTGFGKQPPAEMTLAPGQYYNPYFPGGKLAMPPPLTADGQVTYEDGTQASVDQMARDVVVFLQWAAEPEMEARKQMGLKVMGYLAVLTVLLYLTMKRIMARVH